MLKKKNRLTAGEFKIVFSQGTKKNSRHFLLVHLNPKNIPEKKLSVAISKKVEKKAVVRNQSRRRVYRILRDNLEKLPAGLHAIILITKPIIHLEFLELKEEVLGLLNQ